MVHVITLIINGATRFADISSLPVAGSNLRNFLACGSRLISSHNVNTMIVVSFPIANVLFVKPYMYPQLTYVIKARLRLNASLVCGVLAELNHYMHNRRRKPLRLMLFLVITMRSHTSVYCCTAVSVLDFI